MIEPVKLDDVVGLDEAKTVLKRRLVTYFKFKEQLKSEPGKGILIYGYPGTGKTYLIKAVLGDMNSSNIFIKEVSTSDITGYVGTTSGKISEFFKKLKSDANSKDIVLILDEVDQMIPKKESNQAQGAIVSERISSLLREIDGLSDNGRIFLLCTTNHPGRIEEAFLRSGRIDEHIEAKLPTDDERRLLIKKYLGHLNLKEESTEAIIKHTERWTGADYKKLGGKLEIRFLEGKETDTSYNLSNDEIVKTVQSVNKHRILNFSLFENEYRNYRENLN